jgi:hypothetical protein
MIGGQQGDRSNLLLQPAQDPLRVIMSGSPQVTTITKFQPSKHIPTADSAAAASLT